MRRGRNRQTGFTLSEVLATLALTGITATLAVPPIQSLMRDSRQAAAANDLVASLHGARSVAITRNSRVTLCASANGESCADGAWEDGWIAFADADGDRRREAGDDVLATSPGHAGIHLVADGFADSLQYQGNGQLAGVTPTRIAICDLRGTAAASVLLINAAGKPRLLDSDQARSGLSCPDR